jgi:hypothetical protein
MHIATAMSPDAIKARPKLRSEFVAGAAGRGVVMVYSAGMTTPNLVGWTASTLLSPPRTAHRDEHSTVGEC